MRRAFALAALAALAGCTDGPPPRGPVRGSVQVDGKPLAAGRVRFFALNGGVSTEGDVRDGRYEIPADRGPTAGKYKVEFSAEQPTGRKVPDPDGGPGALKDEIVDALPPKLNRLSTVQVDYDPAAARPFDFDLKTK